MMKTYHVLTPLIRYDLIDGLVENLSRQRVVWHPLTQEEGVKIPNLRWIKPLYIPIPPEWKGFEAYYKFNRFGEIVGWIDQQMYVYLGDDDLYAPGTFDILRETPGELVMMTMRRGDRCPGPGKHGCSTLTADPGNRRMGSIGFEQLVMSGRLRKQWPYRHGNVCEDGFLAERLAASSEPWSYAPRAEVYFNVFEPGRWGGKPSPVHPAPTPPMPMPSHPVWPDHPAPDLPTPAPQPTTTTPDNTNNTKVAIVYVYPLDGRGVWGGLARRFVDCYQRNAPGLVHETVIVCNGAPVTETTRQLFAPLPNCRFLEYDNSGRDIGAFQMAARTVPCDMMVFFGASTFFNRSGWLARMEEAFRKHGNAQYGTMANRGNLSVKVWPHIRTTAFWMAPALMNSYPKIINNHEQRHPFEHGENCFTAWVTKSGLKSWVATWSGESEWLNWDSNPRGFHRGDQSELLAGDHICERPYYPTR